MDFSITKMLAGLINLHKPYATEQRATLTDGCNIMPLKLGGTFLSL